MAKKAGRMIVPWFNADRGWGDMEIFECGDEVVVVDTYTYAMIEARNRLLKILNGRKFSLTVTMSITSRKGLLRLFIFQRMGRLRRIVTIKIVMLL